MKRRIASRCLAGLLTLILTVTTLGTSLVEASTGDIDAAIVAESLQVAKQVEAEGIVLLKNEDGVLPLAAEQAVSVFGSAAIDPYYGSSGSGSIKSDTMIGFYDALSAAGITYNDTLYQSYRTWYGKNGNHKEMPVSELDMTQAREYADTAILMIGRSGSEGNDLTLEELQLSAEESSLIDTVAKTFDHVIVLFNIANMMEMGFLENYPSIQGAAIIWTPGEAGMESVAQMLAGQINPSGKLQDTIAYHVSDHPSTANFGDYTYADQKANFVEYEEGIYVGYRYFETFGVPVQYPFGFGLSYTEFAWSDISFDKNGRDCQVAVTVTNCGERAGKDVVQIYVSLPYQAGGVEKAATQLVAFVKTDLLEPGASARYTATFDIWDCSSYDADGEQAYILDAGDYTVRVAHDVKDSECDFSYALGEKLVKKTDEVSGAEIKNLFSDAFCDQMTVLSRMDPVGTYPTTPVNETCPVDISDMDAAVAPETDADAVAPTIGAIYEDKIMLQWLWIHH